MPKSTFVLSESPFWPKFPLSCVSFGAQRVTVTNGSLTPAPTTSYFLSGNLSSPFSKQSKYHKVALEKYLLAASPTLVKINAPWNSTFFPTAIIIKLFFKCVTHFDPLFYFFQVQKILTMYTPANEYEPRVPGKVIRAVVSKATKQNPDSSTLMMNIQFSSPVNFPFTPSAVQFEKIQIPDSLRIPNVRVI